MRVREKDVQRAEYIGYTISETSCLIALGVWVWGPVCHETHEFLWAEHALFSPPVSVWEIKLIQMSLKSFRLGSTSERMKWPFLNVFYSFIVLTSIAKKS